MLMFAIETSGSNCGAAALCDDRVLASETLSGAFHHSVTLMPLVDQIFCQCGLHPGDIDVYAVSAGPGSFTGIRIGIGTVKGLAFPTGTPCAGVSTLESLAWAAKPCGRLILSVIDARRGRVYTGAFRLEDTPEPLTGEAVVPIEQLWMTYRHQPVLFVGDAAELCYNVWKEKGDAGQAEFLNCQPDVLATARAASHMIKRGLLTSPDLLKPRYILTTQAERERTGRETETNENSHRQ